MKTLFAWLFKIENNYSAYLGTHSLMALYYFINGYTTALENTVEPFANVMFPGFQRYVENYYGEAETAKGWPHLIIEHTPSTEAIKKFYELLYQYYIFLYEDDKKE